MAVLSTKQRGNLAKTQFAIPGKAPGSGSYPIPDASHARNALARVSQHGTPSEQARVRAAVSRKFPGIGRTSEGGVIMAEQGEALQDDARTADKLSQAAHGVSILVEGRRRGRRGALPTRASETAKARSGGQQGRRRRSAKAPLVHAEEGAVVPGIEPRPGEALVPDPGKSSYDAIKEVV